MPTYFSHSGVRGADTPLLETTWSHAAAIASSKAGMSGKGSKVRMKTSIIFLTRANTSCCAGVVSSAILRRRRFVTVPSSSLAVAVDGVAVDEGMGEKGDV